MAGITYLTVDGVNKIKQHGDEQLKKLIKESVDKKIECINCKNANDAMYRVEAAHIKLKTKTLTGWMCRDCTLKTSFGVPLVGKYTLEHRVSL